MSNNFSIGLSIDYKGAMVFVVTQLMSVMIKTWYDCNTVYKVCLERYVLSLDDRTVKIILQRIETPQEV